MRSKIKINELRDRITLYPITGYNDAVTGVPKRTFDTVGRQIYAKVRRAIGSMPDAGNISNSVSASSDKTKVVSNFEITVRIDSIVYKVEDKVIYDGFTLYIKDIKQVDLLYQTLMCYDEY